MSIRMIQALWMKQRKDFVKSFERLILFIIYPVITLIMTVSVKDSSIPERFFVSIFTVMHIVMTPIVAASSIVAEEKEKKTLRELMLANVSHREFMAAVGSFIWVFTIVTAIPFLLLGEYDQTEAVLVLAGIMAGSLVSVLLGITLGVFGKNTGAVTAFSLVAGMFLAMGPMLSNFNRTIYSIVKYFYGQRISDWVASAGKIQWQDLLIIVLNALIVFVLFVIAYRKNEKDE